MHKKRKKTLKFKAIDLFSGCGGLTEGLKMAGFEVVGAVECNKVFVETYELNHPDVKVWVKDIRKIDTTEMMNSLGLKKGELDLLAGCPPCQGFSTIGTKNSKDVRNNLVFEWLRLVRDFRPKTIMMENVPGLLKDSRIRKVIKELVAMGYNLGETPKVLNVAKYGVPQRRKRMVLIGSQKGLVGLAKETEDVNTVKIAIGNLSVPGKSGDPLHDYPEKRSDVVMKRIKMIPKDGGSFRMLGEDFQLPCHKNKSNNGFKDVYGRMKWDAVSPTITGGCTNPSKGRFIHPDQNRSITLREAALLQSFPKDYKFSLTGGKGTVSLMIGNALPPLFISAHALQIRKNLKL